LIELKDKEINGLNLNLAQLKSETSSKDSRIQNLEMETKELLQQQTQLSQSISKLETQKVELNTRLETFKNNKERTMSEKENEFEEISKVIKGVI